MIVQILRCIMVNKAPVLLHLFLNFCFSNAVMYVNGRFVQGVMRRKFSHDEFHFNN